MTEELKPGKIAMSVDFFGEKYHAFGMVISPITWELMSYLEWSDKNSNPVFILGNPLFYKKWASPLDVIESRYLPKNQAKWTLISSIDNIRRILLRESIGSDTYSRYARTALVDLESMLIHIKKNGDALDYACLMPNGLFKMFDEKVII